MSHYLSFSWALVVVTAWGQQYTISTFAGAPTQALPVAATKAAIIVSSAVADASGALYIGSGPAIYKVDRDGILSRIAGGTSGFTGDGGPAVSAQLSYAGGLAVDSSGNLYFCDYFNQRVRKISTDGTITTVAGGGMGGDGGPAVDAKLNLLGPPSTAVDAAGNIYFTESNGELVRKVSTDGVITSAVGAANFGPVAPDASPAMRAAVHASQIAVDSRGNLYLADRFGLRVYIVPPDQTIRTFAGNGSSPSSGDGGPAALAAVAPSAVAADASGNVFILDLLPIGVRKVTPDGMISTLPGYEGIPASGACEQSQDTFALALSIDSAGNLYPAENYQVRRISADGRVETVAGNNSARLSGDGGPATAATFSSPWGVALDGKGNVVITDSGNSTVRKVNSDGIITTLMGDGFPRHRCTILPSSKDPMIAPMGVAADTAGNVLVASGENRVRKIAADGAVTVVAGNGFSSTAPSPLALETAISNPHGVAAGPEGKVYIADTGGGRIELATGDGLIQTYAGGANNGRHSGDGGAALQAGFYAPTSMALDSGGNLFIADTGNHCIRKISADGIVTTVAGNGSRGYSGDGGPATEARMSGPQGVAVDAAGNLYISDTENGAIRKVTPDGAISTIASGMSHPYGLAVDSNGKVYVADSGNGAIQLLSPN